MARLSKRSVRKSIEHYNGNISAVARSFGVSRRAVYDFLIKHPDLKELVDEQREVWKDDAESELMRQAMEDKNTTALIFFLKTQAKDRGYIERSEFTGKDGAPIEIQTLEIIKEAAHAGDADSDPDA